MISETNISSIFTDHAHAMSYCPIKRRRNKHFSRYFFLLMMYLFPGNRCFAQNYYFKHYNIENGLIQSQVLKIFEDSKQYLWLGTSGGVSRFDGTDFTNYTKVDGLSGDVVNSIRQDKDQILIQDESGISAIKNGKVSSIFRVPEEYAGRIWQLTIGSDGNIWFIYRSHLYTMTRKGPQLNLVTAANETIMTLNTDKQGNFFAAVYGKGIFIRKNNGWVLKVPFKGVYKDQRFFKMLSDNKTAGKIYLLTSMKVYVASDYTIYPYKNKMLDTLKDILFSMAQDKQGNLWIGGEKGACYLREKDPVRFNANNGFSNNAVYDIYIDGAENVWLATNGDGFYKFQGFDLVHLSKMNADPLQAIMAVGADHSGNVWIGTYGQGLVRYDGRELKNFLLPSSNPLSKYVVSLACKKGQPLLLGSLAGLWKLDRGKISNVGERYGFPNYVNSVIYDHNNTIWLVSDRGCYYLKQNGVSGCFKNVKGDLQTIAEIGPDSILVGNRQGLILIRNGAVDSSFRFNPLLSSTVLCLERYKQLIVGGTLSEGLFSIDLLKGTVKKYTTKNGLRSNAIYSLAIDEDGTFWAGTGKGIDKFKIDPQHQSIRLIKDLNANPVAEFDQDAILSFNGKVCAGATNGLYIYNVHQYFDISRQSPEVNIESINVYDPEDIRNDKMISPWLNPIVPDHLELKYSKKHIDISFKGIFYSEPEDILYQFRLKGLDKQFSLPSKLNKVDYTSLPPGNYVFEVRAIASNGISSFVRSVPITIIPVFYQTRLFIVVLSVFFILLIILIQWLLSYYKARRSMVLESVKQSEQIRVRRQTAEDFHDDIGNKLTRIVVLTDILSRKAVRENKEVKSIINQIRESAANLYSGAKDILWALDPQSDDLHQVLLKIRNFAIDLFSNTETNLVFEDFDVFYNKSLPLEFTRNIIMIFKELLNNILKHANASQVILYAYTAQDRVELIVTDDGVGFEESMYREGRGLVNMKMRAKRLNGTLDIYSEPGKGTKVILKFDLKT